MSNQGLERDLRRELAADPDKTKAIIAGYERQLAASDADDDDHLNLISGLAITLVMRGGDGDADRAADLFERAIALEPSNGDCHFNLAQLCHARGDREGALAAWRATLAAEPGQ